MNLWDPLWNQQLPIIISSASEPTSPFLEFLKPAVGAFVGAGLAFLTTRLHDAHRRHIVNLACGNRALFTLRLQRSDFVQYRKNTLRNLETRAAQKRPLWSMLYLNYRSPDPHLVDLESLNFLFEHRRNGRVLRQLARCNDLAQELSDWKDFSKTEMVELEREIALVVKGGDAKGWAAIEKELDQHRIETGRYVTLGSARRAESEFDKTIEDVAKLLRQALVRSLEGRVHRFLRTKLRFTQRWLSEPPVIVLGSLKDDFKRENLPKLPAAVQQAIDKKTPRATSNDQAKQAPKEEALEL